jgi:hypothetical protein
VGIVGIEDCSLSAGSRCRIHCDRAIGTPARIIGFTVVVVLGSGAIVVRSPSVRGTGFAKGKYGACVQVRTMDMKLIQCQFGSIEIDGIEYSRDVVLDRGEIRKRKKKASRVFRDRFGHTPLSLEEKIPWKCKRLVIGTGMYGRLPVMEDVLDEAKRRGVEIVQCPTPEALELLNKGPADTNAILHVTC